MGDRFFNFVTWSFESRWFPYVLLLALGLSISYGVWASSKLPCDRWHVMKIATNDDMGRRNDWFQAHSFRVRFDDARYLGEGVVHVTITVCKFCGKPVFKETDTKFVEH